MTTTSSFQEEKDNSSAEGDFKPTIKNGPVAEVNGRDDYIHNSVEMEEEMSFDELQRKYQSLLIEKENWRSGNVNSSVSGNEDLQLMQIEIDDLRRQKDQYQRLLEDINSDVFVDVKEVDDLKSSVVTRLVDVRNLIAHEKTQKERLFSELQHMTIEKDRAVAALNVFRRAVRQQLLDLRRVAESQSATTQSAGPSNGVSRELYEELLGKYDEAKETMARSDTDLTTMRRSYEQANAGKERAEKERERLKKMNKKLQNDKQKFTADKRQLDDQCREAELQVQAASARTTELENENRRLERDLRIKTEEHDALLAEDRNQQQEASKKLMEKEKRVEQQVKVEQELRYDLERRINGLTDERESFEAQMEQLQEKCQKLEREREQMKASYEGNQKELAIGREKLEELRAHERELEREKLEAIEKARVFEEKCGNMHQEIHDIQLALNKKVNREKGLKNREKEVRDRERQLKSQLSRLERNNKVQVTRPTRGGRTNVKGTKHQKNWDPLHHLRILLPWPWICLGLLVLLFFGVLFRR